MSAFTQMTAVLRDHGCRCALRWNGRVPVPATVCNQQQPGTVDRHTCKVLAALPPVPDAPDPLTATAVDVILNRNGV